MNKSQLRKLAREYALGNLEEDEYLQRRHSLIDDIVSGKIAIVREVPPPPRPTYSEDPTTNVSIGAGEGAPRFSPAAVFIVLVIVAGIIWMLIPPDPQEGTPAAGLDQQAQEPPASRARSLIGEFMAQKDFSAFSIASFKESWSHLSYVEKREVYSAHWFNDLINLISDEIEAQNALIGSEEPGNAAEVGRRLSEFASFLGISEYVTDFKGTPERPATAVAASGTDPELDVTATMNELAPRKPPPVPTQESSPGTLKLVPVTEWLGEQPDNAYTLQLFAVNRLDQIQSLVVENPGLDLQVLVSARNEPRYRVVYGAFESEDAARSAYAELPENIRQAQPVPLVKSLSSLREEIVKDGRVAGPDAASFTLQVLATDSLDSARRLQADYPALGLTLLETTNPYTRYRVVYGTFDSEDMARQAAGAMPPELLRDVGDPLVKPLSELKAVSP